MHLITIPIPVIYLPIDGAQLDHGRASDANGMAAVFSNYGLR
jgi:hypothetical protein